jgi:hypothetical protein
LAAIRLSAVHRRKSAALLARRTPFIESSMQGQSTILERVRGLIERLAPEPICDECIAEKLELAWTSQANQAARELVGGGFERRSDICAICGGPRAVTRKTAK